MSTEAPKPPTVFEKMFGEKLTAESAGRQIPMTAQPLTINPDPSSAGFIERQFARMARLRDIDTDEARAEIAQCKANLELSSRTIVGKARVALARRKF